MEAVTLVPFDRTFLDCSFLWLNDPETRYLTDTPAVTREAQEAWFAGLPGREDYKVWGVCADGRPVGVCGLKHIRDGAGEYFGYIGEASYRGRGIGGRMMELLESEARAMGIGRISLCVLGTNGRAIRLYRRHGYVLDRSDERYHYMSKAL